MQIDIRSENVLNFDERTIRTCNVYISFGDYEDVLGLWIKRLEEYSQSHSSFFLPYGLNDEYLTGFEARYVGRDIELRCAIVDAIGYEPTMDNIEEFISWQSPVLERDSDPFIICGKGEFELAIRRALDTFKRNGRTK